MSLRLKLSVAILTVAVLVTTGGPLFAAGMFYQVCAARQHECGTVPRLMHSCCDNRGDISNQPGMPQTRTDLTAESSAVPSLVCVQGTPPIGAGLGPVHTSPLLARPPDLPILFADLRL